MATIPLSPLHSVHVKYEYLGKGTVRSNRRSKPYLGNPAPVSIPCEATYTESEPAPKIFAIVGTVVLLVPTGIGLFPGTRLPVRSGP